MTKVIVSALERDELLEALCPQTESHDHDGCLAALDRLVPVVSKMAGARVDSVRQWSGLSPQLRF